MARRRRVAVTGVGLVSSLGNDYAQVGEKLRRGQSGLRAMPEWREHGLKSLVGGAVQVDGARAGELSPKLRPALSQAGVHIVLAAMDAVSDARLGDTDLRSSRTACLAGCGVAGAEAIHKAASLLYAHKPQLISPYTVLRSMTSQPSAMVAFALGIRGRTYSVSSACATSAHAIGHGYELIQAGKVDRALVGGAEDFGELQICALEALRVALSTHFNDRPEAASRPYDSRRDGFVASGGAGIVVLEAMELALARKARIRGEVIGFGANCDNFDLVAPDPQGRQAAQCIAQALEDAEVHPHQINYINTHGTSTPLGDGAELTAVRAVFRDEVPPLSSTKSMTGHALGAAGVHELIYCLAMMEGGFIAPSINIDAPDPAFADLPIATRPVQAAIDICLSNSFGFGGANACLILKRCPQE
jgi:3-oxoacyl-[acyl-carrier-protein] synthase I